MNQRRGSLTTLVIGILCLLGGLIWGLAGSHQISYQQSQQGTTYVAAIGEKSGNIYLHAQGSSEYYVALSDEFSQVTEDYVGKADNFSFVARTDTTEINLDVNGTTIKEAHKIEQLTLLNSQGSAFATYVSPEYKSNPDGVYSSAWGGAFVAIIFGVVFILAGFFDMRRRRRLNTNFSIGGTPGAQPVYPGNPPAYPGNPPAYPGNPPAYPPAPPADPYGQAYRGPEQ
jgi:hypothetical protein